MPRRERLHPTPVELYDTDVPITSSPRPFSPAQALMEAGPGDEPDVSQMELLDLRDLLADTIDEVLTDLEKWVFTETVVARRPLRRLGIPKTTVARVRDRAVAKLRGALDGNEMIRRHLEAQ